jgi:hypothetical protein
MQSSIPVDYLFHRKKPIEYIDYTLENDCITVNTNGNFSIPDQFGPRGIRWLYKISCSHGHEGEIKIINAEAPTRLFYLLMGMIPKESETNYIDQWGSLAKMALNALIACEKENDIYNVKPFNVFTLQRLLAENKNIPEDLITNTMLFENKAFLLNLAHKKVSNIQNKFVPHLLKFLKEEGDDSETVTMFLSEEGKARWIEAIEQNKLFQPFDDLAHLRKYMTENQINELDKIISKKPLFEYTRVSKETEEDLKDFRPCTLKKASDKDAKEHFSTKSFSYP